MDLDLQAQGWQLDPDDGFIGHVGGLWRRKIDGRPQFAFVARDFHANRNGVVHGGMLMSFMDRAMGHTARTMTGAHRGATISLNHQFLAAVRMGELVEIAPEMSKATTRLVFMSGTALVGDDPVVTAQGVWRMATGR